MASSMRKARSGSDPAALARRASKQQHANLSLARWIELAVHNEEGLLADTGALAVSTGARTGRSPKDRFIEKEADSETQIHWGKINQPIEPAHFQRMLGKITKHLRSCRRIFLTDGEVCADPAHRLRVRVLTEYAWQAQFAHNLYRRLLHDELSQFQPDWTILAAPNCEADPKADGVHSDAFIGISFSRRLVLIAGTHYAGEIKKSIFSVLNYLLPQHGVFPMHCASNIGERGDVALFFGLSGTGKTTLSADPSRRLIGDDEHGWSDNGVFNIEGGCYAKTIRLSAQGEPQIWNAIRFGTVLENVVVDPVTRVADYADSRMTENTRAAYPLDFIPDFEKSGRGGHPSNVFFLTCDAFGVLPPLARLSPEQAMYHFLSGYTAKVAGTETDVKEPTPNFSTCFAAPFLPLHPTRYAELLRQKIQAHRCPVWLVNTGWTGGPYKGGKRMSLTHTRALLRAALAGGMATVLYDPDPFFNLQVPRECPGVPAEVLKPRSTWKDAAAYDAQARKLAKLFRDNFAAFADSVPEKVRAAGPRTE
ncbi:MAG TPA: phosphoenolpyruvate carboxykinase (ATP) [Gemmataceae bacterium]|jgi:phosphoenolpyruvate carboxykinase (ATP)|nr:phosphoenolpyruvate carboxykinase (ATP) [Gemmataceae bacterium]